MLLPILKMLKKMETMDEMYVLQRQGRTFYGFGV